MSELIAITGQSLALGFGVSADELPGDFHPSPLIRILTDHGFETMTPGVNTGTPANPGAWGPEVGIAMEWLRARPGEELDIVKSVKGSTGLAEDPAELDWSPHSAGELFDHTAAMIARAKALTGLQLSNVFWVQGQQDAVSHAKALAYGANLTDFDAHVRAEWGDDGTQIIVAQVSDESGLPFADLVRIGQTWAASRDHLVRLVTDDGLTYQADGLHLDGAGELTLGERMYGAAYAPPLAETEPQHPWHHDLARFAPSGWVFEVAGLLAVACTILLAARGDLG